MKFASALGVFVMPTKEASQSFQTGNSY